MKIENNKCVVEFSEDGGEITRFFNKETNLQYMYQGDSKYWAGKNPTLFPIVGNTYDSTYEAKGKTYTFKNHGIIRNSKLKCVSQNDTSITFELVANEETLRSYPYQFRYQICYMLLDTTLKVAYNIKNEDDEIMPFTFGLHPGFKVPLLESESYEDYVLSFECEEEMQQLIFDPNKQVPHYYKDVKFKEFNLDYEVMNQYATLIYKGYNSSYVTLKGKENHGVKVSIAGYPLLALWAPDNAPFYCIEPWYSHADFEKSDTAFKDRVGMMELAPNKEFETSYTIEVF